MLLFVFGVVDTEFSDSVRKFLMGEQQRGTEILVVSNTKVCEAMHSLPSLRVKICSSVEIAMESCDKALALWDVRISETGRIMDMLRTMQKPVRIYDVLMKQWC